MKPVAFSRTALCASVFLCLLAGAEARPGDTGLLPEVLGTAEIYAADSNSGLALRGRDPVAYQFSGVPRVGVNGHEALWSGLGWRFASEANRAAFLRSPEAFAPRVGGYDAEEASKGRLVEADPDIFLVRSGRLYFFRTTAARARFEADAVAASRAEANWPRLQKVLVRG
jgi:YHS domain-containing protein